MKSYKTDNKCLIINHDHDETIMMLGYFDKNREIEKVLTLSESDHFSLNGWINLPFKDRKKLNELMFEMEHDDKLAFYISKFLGEDRKYEIKDDNKSITFYRDDEYNIYIIFRSNVNTFDINEKFKVSNKGDMRLSNLFNDILDNLNVDDHQMTIDEYLYERKLKQ